MRKYLTIIKTITLFLLFWIKSKTSSRQFLLLSSVIVGIFSGTAVVILKTFAHWVVVSSAYLDRILKLPYSNSIFPIIGILLTVYVTQRFLGGKIDKGLSQIMHSVARKSSILPEKQMYAQIITNSLTVGLGGSGGIESPVAITGAAFGSNFAQHFRLSYKERTLLLACGVAAATAAAFNAPIAGVLFAIEVILADMSVTAFIPIMISAATGAMISGVLLSKEILLNFSEKYDFEFHDIWFYILLGLLTGWFSVYYSRNFQRVTEHFQNLKFKPYRKAIYGAGLLALLIFVLPTLFGQGYESIKILTTENPEALLNDTIFSGLAEHRITLIAFVLLTLLFKVFAVAFTLNSGGNGGNFAPSLFVGSYLGFLFAYLINLTEWIKIPVGSFTLVGMAGVFSGLFHAPLTAIFLIGEITGGYTLMVPLLIVSSISFAVSKRMEVHSLDVKKLAKKGEIFTSNKDRNILSSIALTDVLITNYQTLSPEDHLERLVDIVSQTNQRDFAVVNQQNELVGILNFKRIRHLIFNNYNLRYSKIAEVMLPLEMVIQQENSLYIMLEKLEQSQSDYLPLVKNKKYIGFVSKMKILEQYREKLKSIRVE